MKTLGFGALLLALALAPFLGGAPAGEKYGGELMQGALRILVLIAALLNRPLAPNNGGTREGGWGGVLLWFAVAWSGLSLLVHSTFFTSPVLLFAQIPAVLDLLCAALLFTLAAQADETQRPKLVYALLVGLGLHALMAAQQYGAAKQAGEDWQRATGFFFSPNFSAGFIALLLPLALCACLQATHRLAALGLGTVTALACGALVASGSRVGVRVALLSVAIALVLHPPSLVGGGRALRRGGRLLAVAAAGAVIAFGFKGALASRDTKTGGQPATTRSLPFVDDFRLYTWQGTAAMVAKNPLLGTGPGTFPYLYPQYATVAQTDLGHESYLQLAAENGIPTVLGLVLTALAALVVGLRRRTDLLTAGLIGGLVAALLRGLFDSEWALLGNLLPFWTVAGLLTHPSPSLAAREGRREGRAAGWVLPALGLVFALLNQTRVFPPQPADLAASNPAGLAEAAKLEPTPRWHFQLARLAERDGKLLEAVAAFEKARAADPNNLQTLRALAETQEKASDKAGAEKTWRELVRVAEGPVGRVRALPEVTETHPAFAYAALGEWGKCADVIEAYSRTELAYQKMELGDYSPKAIEKARSRRAELRALYEKALEHLPERSGQKEETLGRLDKFFLPGS